ncbi:MAG: GntR family transcriptional regulator [Alphaproteobacteria bacterium]|jgi:GntR family transcriptional regulator of vanillate catabolism|uniref:GntR family transcriptional regulator n=1 Tax=Pacificispira sp. TaxID=2888761 RepID=UPI001B12E4C3|nr:GntR family transcriptional regulator [Alphaproteobacteria bacterium]MBO6863846.1 GntR family transcriptional regulator [Alphaproteobacteria bacterium]MEC9267019.1 GntR family transcriptional regulator [Pseudomonadota bacterium]
MATQLDQITQNLRELVLEGAYEPGAAVREVAVAEKLGVSRTLTRLAMAALEQDGLLLREPNRGFRVRSFTLDEVADAIEVRGELEALAARQAAERGLSPALAAQLRAILAEAEAVAQEGFKELSNRSRWIDLNCAFHSGIVEGSANKALAPALDHICRVPLAGPRAIVFNRTVPDQGIAQLKAAHDDHVQILDAILNRQGQRAAALIREHAYRSGRNKRANFDALQQTAVWPALPGVALVRRAGNE